MRNLRKTSEDQLRRSFSIKEIIFMLTSISLTIITLILLRCDYAANDDFYMMLIASGEYGSDSQYLIFINIIIGYFLKMLYSIVPTFNWYVAVQLGSVIICFWILSFYILKNFEWIPACIIKTIMFLCFEIPFYTSIQFSQTAVVLCATGYVLLYYGCHAKRKSVTIIAVIILLFGGLYREGLYKLTTVLAVGMGFWGLFTIVREKSYLKIKQIIFQWIKSERSYILISALVYLTIYGLTVYNTTCYYDSNDFKAYKEYRADISNITDYKMASWNMLHDKYIEAGISQEEYVLLDNYILADFDVFDHTELQKIIDIKTFVDNKETFWANFVNILKSTFFITDWNFGYLIVIGSAIFFTIMVGNRYGRFKLLIQFAIFIGIILFFCYIGRTREYIEIGLAFSTFMSFVLAIQGEWEYRKTKSRNLIITLFILGTLIGATKNINEKQIEINNFKQLYEADVEALYSYMRANENNFYMLNTNDTSYEFFGFPMNYIKGNQFCANRYRLGDWMVNTPFTNKILKEYGIRNPIESMITKENVFFVCRDDNMLNELCSYYSVEYQKAVVYDIVEQIGGYQVVKFTEVNE